MALIHQPVLLKEVVDFLRVKPGGRYVDGTLGGGGHAEAVLERMEGRGLYVGIDRDPEALVRCGERLAPFKNSLRLVRGVYSEIPAVLKELGIESVDGILIDLGVSSFQLDEAERGFSFLKEGPLDMRMDPADPETAEDIVNRRPEKELEEIFYKFGEERFARRIARAIVAFRRDQPFKTTTQLAGMIEGALPPKFRGRRFRIHPATRVFQALRIAVNRELEHLSQFLGQEYPFLIPGGRLAIISFHSLEDRRVKNAFRSRQDLRVITKRPVVPGEAECVENPRARSAKLRVAEKI